MALTNYTELKTSIANWLNRSDLTSEISGDFIALCEADFNAKLRIRQMEQIDPVTIDAETVEVPEGFIAARSFYVLSGDTKYNLEYISPANLFKTKGASSSGLPPSIESRGRRLHSARLPLLSPSPPTVPSLFLSSSRLVHILH